MKSVIYTFVANNLKFFRKAARRMIYFSIFKTCVLLIFLNFYNFHSKSEKTVRMKNLKKLKNFERNETAIQLFHR